MCDSLWYQQYRVIVVLSHFSPGAILWCYIWMGIMLWLFQCLMLEFIEDIFNVTVHQEVDGTIDVVPFRGHTNIESSFPVCSELIEVLDIRYYIPNVLLPDVIHSEIDNDE